MPEPNGTNEILGLLAQHETRLEELYKVYVRLFPIHAELWQQMADEEVMHASWLREMPGRLEAEGIHLNTQRFRRQAVVTSIESVIREGERATQPGYTKRNALAAALSFETAMLEKDFFAVLECAAAGCKELQARLVQHTRAHRERIQQCLQASG
jgi:hypothetical protein